MTERTLTPDLISSRDDLEEVLQQNDDTLRLFYADVEVLGDFFLNGNSKLHDLSQLELSIERHKFADPIKFDRKAPNGKDDTGAIVEGNGRLELIEHMWRTKREAPKGIQEYEGRWYIPIIFGADSESLEDAVAYSISHNLSPLWGSKLDFSLQSTAFDSDALKRQLDPLRNAELLPIGIQEDDADLILGVDFGGYDEDGDGQGGDNQIDKLAKGIKKSIQIEFMAEDYEKAAEIIGFWRQQDIYLGGRIIEFLEDEKNQLEE